VPSSARWAAALAPAVIGFICLSATGSATNVTVKTEHDPAVDFGALHSYRWLPTPPYLTDGQPKNRDRFLSAEALDALIRDSVDRALATRRIKPARGTDTPDCYVIYYAAVGVALNANVLGAHYGYASGWGAPALGSTGMAPAPQVIEQGTLVIDVVRSDRARAIWRGTASGAVRTDEERRRAIESAVDQMFAQFPRAR
jgi:hypothetical protein